MTPYPVVVFWSAEDQAYIADVPDIRYCSAHGETPEEALAEVLIGKRLWLDSVREHGEPLPEASPAPSTFALSSR